jgi:hypothetical protein
MSRARLATSVWLLAVLGAGVPAISSPELTAEQLVERYLEARGGAERWRQVETLKLTGTYAAVSKRSDFTLLRKQVDLYRLDFTMVGAPATRARDAAGPWMQNPWLQPEAGRVTEDPYKRQLERESLFPLLLLDYQQKGFEVESLGPGDVDGIPTVNLKVTLADGQEETWYFDAETYLEVAADSQIYDHTQFMEPIRQRVFFDDFREVEGLRIPFQVDMEFGARLESMTVDEVVINAAIDDAQLSPPPPQTTD